ncbi:Ig-like domain-containing protein [Catenovulum sp. SX2]|uniref:Ig-like domain-containing protein n=1 Tax=Catenovulum sp. SX2 TaxID=3398614 RepID=UPI003F840F98
MLKQYRYWFVSIMAMIMVACGGGGNLDNGNGDSTEATYQISLTAVDSTGAASNQTSQDNPLTVTATLTADGAAASGQIISFSTQSGVLVPASGQVVTNSSGQAQVILKPGSELTADSLIAQFNNDGQTVSQQINYTNQGDGEEVTEDTYTISVDTYICNTASFDTVAEVESNCTQGAIVSNATPLYFLVSVLQNSNQAAVSNKLIRATAGTGTLLPENGNAILNNGTAIFKLFSDGTRGSDEISLTFEGQTQTQVYQINTSQVTPTHGYALALSLTDVNGTAIAENEISKATSGVLQVTLTLDGQAVTGEIVTVSSNVGVLKPASGSLLTDNNGQAKLVIGAGSTQSSGTLSATATITSGTQQIDLEESLNFKSAGDDIAQAPSDYTLDINLFASDEVTPLTNVTRENKGILVATLRDSAGDPVENEVVTFTTTLGGLFPALGTALTDNNGRASIELEAGEVKGAGSATVTYLDASQSVAFTSAGDANVAAEEHDITISIFDCNGVDNPVIPFTSCAQSPNVSLTRPGKVLVRVNRKGSSTDVVANSLITATVDAGSVSPTNGRVVTNSQGYAVLTLLAGDDDGAGQITIQTSTSTQSAFYTINTVNIAMGNGSEATFEEGVIASDLAGGSLAVGNTTVLTLSIVDKDNNNELYQDPVTVSLSSACASQEPAKAFIDQTVTAINGIATAIYRADGCQGKDSILAQASAGTSSLSATLSIDIDQAPASYIKFVSAEVDGDAEARIITYPGTGRTEQANIVFQVIDSNDNPYANQTVNFSVTAEGAGITVTPSTAKTNSNGEVTVTVRAGKSPTPVRVIAEVVDSNGDSLSPKIQSTSDLLSVSSGLPDQNSFTLAAETYNIEGWDFIGDETPISVYLSDHFNNPVPNGTSISFVTSHGQIQPECVTDNGRCNVQYTVTQAKPGKENVSRVDEIAQNLSNGMCDVGNDDDPTNDTTAADGLPCYGISNTTSGALGPLKLTGYKAGRLSVLAYAVGEESFVDANGNGQFDAGEYFGDMSEAFIDWNEDNLYCGRLADGTAASGAEPITNPATAAADSTPDGACLPGGDDEEFIDFGGDQQGNLDLPNQQFDAADGIYNGILCQSDDGSCNQDFIHVRRDITIVLSGSTPYFRVIDSATDADLTVADLVNNTSVSFIAYITDENSNPMPSGTTVTISTDNGVVSGVSSHTFGNTTDPRPSGFSFTLGRESSPNNKSSGTATITVTTPKGFATSRSISVVDAG